MHTVQFETLYYILWHLILFKKSYYCVILYNEQVNNVEFTLLLLHHNLNTRQSKSFLFITEGNLWTWRHLLLKVMLQSSLLKAGMKNAFTWWISKAFAKGIKWNWCTFCTVCYRCSQAYVSSVLIHITHVKQLWTLSFFARQHFYNVSFWLHCFQTSKVIFTYDISSFGQIHRWVTIERKNLKKTVKKQIQMLPGGHLSINWMAW